MNDNREYLPCNSQARIRNFEPEQTRSKLQILQLTLGLLGDFFLIELVAVVVSHSLSLLAGLAHVFSDIAALSLTLFAHWLSRRWQQHPLRIEAKAALLNGVSLIAIALWIAHEAVTRFQSSAPEIAGLPMLFTAGISLSVNSCNAIWLHSCSHNDLNFHSAFLYTIADIFSSLGVLVAATLIVWLHWSWADQVISLLVSGLILLLSIPLLRQSIHQLRYPAPVPTCACDRQAIKQLLYPSLQERLL